MTSALQSVSRVDDGTASPADVLLADDFDRLCQAQAFKWPEPTAPCLVCGDPDGPECDTCTADWDRHIDRLTDA